MGRVAGLCCIACRALRLADDTPAEVHHIKTGQGRKRANDFDTMPLCFIHHRGPLGIHTLGLRAWQAFIGFDELALLVLTRQLLGVA